MPLTSAQKVASRYLSTRKSSRLASEVDYQAVQRFLDDLPTSVATKGMDGPLLAEFKSLYPRLIYSDFGRGGSLTIPDRLLKAMVSQQTLTLYRGTGGNELREALTGKVTHRPFANSSGHQFGPIKYLTTNLRYVQSDYWGGLVIAYKFSGKLLGPLSDDLSLREPFSEGFLVDTYVRMLLRRGTFWKEHPNLCDGVYGQEGGVPNVMTYGIENLSSLTVDVRKTKILNDWSPDSR